MLYAVFLTLRTEDESNLAPRVFAILKMAAGSKTPKEMQQNTPRIVEYFIMRHIFVFTALFSVSNMSAG